MSTDVDEHLDPPTLIDVSYLRGMAVRNVDVFIKLALLHAENCEEHIAHMARLLAAKGIHCVCTDSVANPQCLIHVHENFPDDDLEPH